jgi:crossover junction endodeoxyribonuclease RuvC
VETQFHGINTKSAFMLGQVRGAVLLSFAKNHLPYGEYSPATIKKTVAGNGRASKEQMIYMVSLLTGTRELEKSSDAADALGIAYTHFQQHKNIF